MDFHSNLKLVFDSQDRPSFPLGFASEGVEETLFGITFSEDILNFLPTHACASYFGSVFLYLICED